eukprot:CAMPEP_0114122612 /NCGR_PEP_ID=MMETSP0043_2-20121206/7789_1 /TAXON_ID=464988 /ORGANISM="Hemiselmis andersenii, Strain CCMP644" /LENGTH=248 /DNA_ID=CAMNT_0001215341 /DNA_START=66 /DNA_END=812 /DNA_ORIENTATION=+
MVAASSSPTFGGSAIFMTLSPRISATASMQSSMLCAVHFLISRITSFPPSPETCRSRRRKVRTRSSSSSIACRSAILFSTSTSLADSCLPSAFWTAGQEEEGCSSLHDMQTSSNDDAHTRGSSSRTISPTFKFLAASSTLPLTASCPTFHAFFCPAGNTENPPCASATAASPDVLGCFLFPSWSSRPSPSLRFLPDSLFDACMRCTSDIVTPLLDISAASGVPFLSTFPLPSGTTSLPCFVLALDDAP